MVGTLDGAGLKGGSAGGWKAWSTKKKLLVVGSVLLAIIALAVGLGVGLGVGLNNGGDDEGEGGGGDNETPPTTGGNDTSGSLKWKPKAGTSWQIELLYPLNDTSHDVDVYDIDLFTNKKETIDDLHEKGRKVICYFSAGSYENWRPDKGKFKEESLGSVLKGWENERWIDLRSDNVREIMTDRLDMAVKKGCDGVDPDNVDGYDNKNGLDLTPKDSANFMNWLADESHKRNMSIGLKNAAAIVPSVINKMQWSVNEQCAQYEECDKYAAFVQKDKPVFHIEYPKGDDTNNDLNVSSKQKNKACAYSGSGNFSTVIKNMDLDNWIEKC